MKDFIARARKALVVVVGLLAQAVAAGLVPDKYAALAAALLGVATALGVYRVPNAPAAAEGEHRETSYEDDVA